MKQISVPTLQHIVSTSLMLRACTDPNFKAELCLLKATQKQDLLASLLDQVECYEVWKTLAVERLKEMTPALYKILSTNIEKLPLLELSHLMGMSSLPSVLQIIQRVKESTDSDMDKIRPLLSNQISNGLYDKGDIVARVVAMHYAFSRRMLMSKTSYYSIDFNNEVWRHCVVDMIITNCSQEFNSLLPTLSIKQETVANQLG